MLFVFPGPTTIARGSIGLVRAMLGLVTTSAGWIMIGTGLMIGGLIWGLNSYQVSYIVGNQGVYAVSEYNDLYTFRQEKTGDLYVIEVANFRPGLAGVFDGSATSTVPEDFSFLASSDTVFVGWGIGLAHPIEEVHFDGVTFISTQYQRYPHGYTVNNWRYASPLMCMGIVCIGISAGFLARTRKQQRLAAAEKQKELDALPSPFVRELSEETMQSDK